MERDKALEAALGQIEKQFGKGSVMRMGENNHMAVEAISTGATALDLALGIGGLPRGRIVEIFGPESSGKSTLAMHVVAESQRNGGHLCVHRRRARHGPRICKGDRPEHRRSAHLAARHRGAGSRDSRHADPFGCDRRDRRRLGCSSHSSR